MEPSHWALATCPRRGSDERFCEIRHPVRCVRREVGDVHQRHFRHSRSRFEVERLDPQSSEGLLPQVQRGPGMSLATRAFEHLLGAAILAVGFGLSWLAVSFHRAGMARVRRLEERSRPRRPEPSNVRVLRKESAA